MWNDFLQFIRWERGANGENVSYLTIAPGEVHALPPHPIRVRVVSGTAYISHAGRDLFVWRGETRRLIAMPRRVWGCPLLSALGKKPVVVSVYTEGGRG